MDNLENQMDNLENQQAVRKKVNMRPVIIGLVAVVLVIVLAIVFIMLQSNPEKLIAKGKYEEAYKKADTSEKNKILAENVIAVLSEKSSGMLKNPSSFVLREGYYKAFHNSDTGKFVQQAVLYISGTNSFGGFVSSYWVWSYDNDTSKWELLGSCTTTSFDKEDDVWEMLAKLIAEDAMKSGIELDKTQVKAINTRFEKNTLDTINLIPVYEIDKSLFPTQ